MSTFEEAWDHAQSVDGWLLEAQGRALFDAASHLAPGTAAVEIGSHRGKSATIIALALPPGARLTAVDPFDDPRWGGGPESLATFTANMQKAGVDDRVDLFRGLSEEASATWDGPLVGFLWVDGAHDVTSTLKDFDGWLPHMAPGSWLYVHDAFSAIGTTRAILQRLWFSSRVEYVGCERTLVKFRVERLSASRRVTSGLRLMGRFPFFARMVAIKVCRRRRWHRAERFFMTRENEPLI